MGLRRVDGSGCGKREKGDLGAGSPFFVEAKTAVGTTLRLQRAWFRKAVDQAAGLRKPFVVLQLAVAGTTDGAPPPRWVAVRAGDLRVPPKSELPGGTRLDATFVPRRAPYRLWPDDPTRWLLYPENWFEPRRFRASALKDIG